MLIVTMFITIALAAVVMVFSREARVYATASANRTSQTQASFIAHGALQYVMAQLAARPGHLFANDTLPAEAMEMGGGYFWLVRRERDGSEGLEFGITDEGSKLNINVATRNMLIKLPQMEDELASSIIDWRDGDSDPEPSGAESSYYLALDDGYYAKDGPFEIMEELLFVRGAEKELIFGEDTNRNGDLDLNENDGETTAPSDNSNGVLDRGLLEYLTVYTSEPNTDTGGEPRVSINESNPQELLQVLTRVLGAEEAQVVLARIMVNRPFRNLLQLYFRIGLTESQLDALFDVVTTSDQPQLLGLINVNSAPQEVLAALPGLTEDDAASLVAARAESDADKEGISWVVEVLSREKAVAIGDYIGTRSFQFTVDVVAVSPRGRSFKRFVAVIDASGEQPRTVHFEDVTALGWPLEMELLQKIRNGTFVGGNSSPVILKAM